MIAKKRSVSTKIVVLLVASAIAICGAISGSIAWLMDATEDVKSTFMVGNINITMNESTPVSTFSSGGLESSNDVFYMTPGMILEINAPEITVSANSEQCYLFVKVDENMGALPTDDDMVFKDYLYYELESGWTAGDDSNGVPTGVYYRIVTAEDFDQDFLVINNNEVTVVGQTVTKPILDDIEATGQYPELTFSAYAVQYYSSNAEEFTPADAWEMVSAEVN